MNDSIGDPIGSIDDPIGRLTDDQRRLLRLLASGATTAEVAGPLGLPTPWVRREVAALLRTLGLRSPAEATVLWWGSRAGARADLRAAALALVA